MKTKSLLLATALLLTAEAFAQSAPPLGSDTSKKIGPVLRFEVTEISDTAIITTSNTAAVKEKNYKYAEFRFMNAGDEPLVIESVSQPAPCFSAAWPRTPIPPGEGGSIKVTCPGKPEGDKIITGFTVTSNDSGGIKLIVLRRHFIVQK